MDAQVLYDLLEKYKAGNCTATELELLNDWYASLGENIPDEVLEEGSDASVKLTHQKLQELRTKLGVEEHTPVRRMRRTTGWAAAIIGVAVITTIAVFQLRKNDRQEVLAQQMSHPADHSRHVVLPDGSTVVLHAGSRLEYPVSFGNVREVTMEGEAYFDIKKDTGKPFIIHSGKVLTTVLGTAFNIRAYKDSADITVSVTRGKVKVETEDSRTLLAVLTPDQQVVYSTITAASRQQPVKALAQVMWVRQDMIFEDESFEEIASTISKRYQVNIRFNNEALKKCRIRASFNGMESLEEVLGVLCTVRNASYQVNNDFEVIIDGKGCEN